MPTHRLFITTDEAGASTALDILGTAFEDEGHAVATTEIDEDAGIWQASVYVEDESPDEMKAAIAGYLADALPGCEIETEELPEIDWVTHSLEGLKPVRAGRFLVHGSHDKDAARIGDIGILIDAAQAFGTGHHGTTAGCLEMLDSVIRGWPAAKGYPSPVLDLGTGSGVLAIAAARLTPTSVLATDIDPVATRVALENMKINKVGNQVRAITAAGFHSPEIANAAPFELIVANILARPLMKMAPEIRNALAPGGSVILSGILAEQRWKVLAAFNAQGMAHVRTIWRNGWVTIHLR
ncbi:50S ribosomal protein L11 methyltransferase [Pseudohoeflea suaedae]|uniref:Ribosomal protein L11 methyltransferase n=1 Tax=Pseudohoeflea suaedae TaxID=877384 RepID=A0A4R5PH59_9HYPH|nr:50S ribosomal protein L11 methyltransferase [Pseudohoeflea suaedae]TDH34236.1 50S ribosomal protein L11 methyltransferase [Pseudohoeflea suaedae]